MDHFATLYKSTDIDRVDQVLLPEHCSGTWSNRSLVKAIAPLLSHDIRHHLSIVYCNAEFMSESAIETERKQLFEELKLAIGDVTKLLDFILLSARRAVPPKDVTESFNRLIDEIVAAIRPHPHATGVDISVRDSPSIVAHFNKTIVSSAVYNLVLNACHASQCAAEPGRVEISLHDDPSFVCIRVRDNGSGVPAWMRKGLSLPIDAADRQDGRGLGITIVTHVARAYGGSLQVETSSPGYTILALRFAKTVLASRRQASSIREAE
jgi:C4-dicarboxylate-specific signal transduction histidine kinase